MRYCRTCMELYGEEVLLFGWFEVLKHIWKVHLPSGKPAAPEASAEEKM